MSVAQLTKAFQETLSLKDKEAANASVVSKFADQKLTDIQAAEQHQWLTLSTRFPEGLDQLNEVLKTRTYILDTQEPSSADAGVLGRIVPFLKTWKQDELVKNRHIVRWADLIQNILDIKEKVSIDLGLEAPREIKEKKKKEAEKDKKEESTAAKGGVKKEQPRQENSAENKNKGPPKDAAELEALKAAKKEKKEKTKKEKKPQPAKVEVPITPGMIDLRVGFIEKAVKHPDADSLYVSTIHMGDEEPRTVCSGLVKYVPLEDMQGRYVITVANLKPVTMRGIKSSAMVLCASNEETVQFVNPPAGSKAGDKIFFETYDIEPEAVLNPKKKIWETIQPGFSTNEQLEVVFRKDGEPDRKLVNKKGELCLVKSLVGAEVR